jgi:hypothetical protein
MLDYTKLKENYIKKIIKECPDMKVIYVDLKNNKRWSTEKIITELTKEERNEFNLRKSFNDEIILDIEEKYRLYSNKT